MGPSGPRDYVLDLGHRANCACIENAAPGEALKVLVYPVLDPSAERILAIGTLSPNSQWFIVDVTTPDGDHDSYSLNYRELKRTISICNSV